jgi:hypothetical protein
LIDPAKAKIEIDSLINWQADRKRWHQAKTRQKMANAKDNWQEATPMGTFSASDFGLHAEDIADLAIEDEAMEEELAFEEEDDETDAITAEKRRRSRQETLRRTAGQPAKPPISEIHKMKDIFLASLKQVLSE